MTESPFPGPPTTPLQLSAAYAELSGMLTRAEPFDTTLLRVAQLLKQSNPEVLDVSVSMLRDDRANTVVYTGAVAIDLDERQYEHGSGPCLDAARSGGTVVVVTEPMDPRYPAFGAQARERRVGLTVSTGLFRPGGVVAGMNVYAGPGQPADDAWLGRIWAFANYASLAVAKLAAVEEPLERERLRQVVASRAVIDRAAAALVGRHQYSREAAMTELLTESRIQQRPLVAVAAAVLA
jgi:hypothetical protein